MSLALASTPVLTMTMQHPSVLQVHSAANEKAFKKFRNNHFVKRAAGFGSSQYF